MTTVSWISLMWTDKRLAWTSDAVGNAPSYLVLPASEIWLPDIVVSNSHDPSIVVGDRDVSLAVFDSGLVLWVSSGRFTTSCPMRIAKFPFDVQQCELVFTSNLGAFSRVHIVAPRENSVEVSWLYEENTEWELTNWTVKESLIEEYALHRLHVQLTLQRKTRSRVLFDVVPVVTLSALSPCVFLLPADSGEKVSLAITVFLSFFVFLTGVDEKLPPSSTEVCLYSGFLQALVAVSAASTIVECLVLHLHSRRRPLSQPWAALLACTRAIKPSCGSRVTSLPTRQYITSDVTNKGQRDDKKPADDVPTVCEAALPTLSARLLDVTKAKDVSTGSDVVEATSLPSAPLPDGGLFEEEWKEVAQTVDVIAFFSFSTAIVMGWTGFALYITNEF